MSEQETAPQNTESNNTTSSGNNSDSSWKVAAGLAALAIIIVAGVVLSVVILFRGEDAGPLVSTDSSPSESTVEVEQSLFEQDPYFDGLGRVVYVPLDSNGVALPQSALGDRPVDQAPAGVMLQRVHGNMVLPFSTSDGPTRITDSGVAAGFSRTAQGAGLAAAHYVGYLASGLDRITMLDEAGFLSDPEDEFVQSPLVAPDSSPTLAMPMVSVDFNPDLSLVKFGYVAEMTDGSSQNMVANVPMVWREGPGWVVKADSAGLAGGSVPSFGEGWASWWG